MKILQMADLHLGAKNNFLPVAKQNVLKESIMQEIEQLFLLAKKDFDVVLICGDLFHGKSVTNKIKNQLFSCIQNYEKPVIYITGNHDEKSDFSSSPSNFIILNENRPKFDVGGVTFYGQVSPQKIEENFDENQINILLLHGNIETIADNDFIDIGQYVKTKFYYVAMGHIHTFKAYSFAGTPYVYSGSLFSNGFDETGNKGYVSLNIDKSGVQYAFVPFCKHRYMRLNCDITGLNSYSAIEDATVHLVYENCKVDDIIDINFCGEVDENSISDFSFAIESLKDYFYITIHDNTKIKIDIEKIRQEKLSFKAEFLRLVESDENLTDEEKRIVIKLGLEALKGENLSI